MLVDRLCGARRLVAGGRRIGISVVTRCELFAGRDDAQRLRRLLAAMIELPVDAAIVELAGVTRRPTGVTMPDARTAATALTHRVPLMTRNRKHFDRIAELEVVAAPSG